MITVADPGLLGVISLTSGGNPTPDSVMWQPNVLKSYPPGGDPKVAEG